MSGGRYEYLCQKLGYIDSFYFPDVYEENVDAMISRLRELNADDVANEVEECCLHLTDLKDDYNSTIKGTLRKVLEAVEWYDSGDWGLEDVNEAIEKWRETYTHLEYKKKIRGWFRAFVDCPSPSNLELLEAYLHMYQEEYRDKILPEKGW